MQSGIAWPRPNAEKRMSPPHTCFGLVASSRANALLEASSRVVVQMAAAAKHVPHIECTRRGSWLRSTEERKQAVIVADVLARLREGQMAEVEGSVGVLPDDVLALFTGAEHGLEVIAGETLLLIETMCLFGAMFFGVDAGGVEAAARHLLGLGMAFQVSDDLIDRNTDAEVSGKVAGINLCESLRTLPVCHVLDAARASCRVR